MPFIDGQYYTKKECDQIVVDKQSKEYKDLLFIAKYSIDHHDHYGVTDDGMIYLKGGMESYLL